MQQAPDPGTGGADHVARTPIFVTAQIVHNHDVAGSERGNEHLFDIEAEDLTVERAREDEGALTPSFLRAARKVEVVQ